MDLRNRILTPTAATLAALVTLAAAAAPAAAQEVPGGSAGARRATARTPAAYAARAVSGTQHLDGVLDEATWRDATPISDFTQRNPNEGQPGTEQTEVRVLFTDDALFIGVRAWDSQADAIVGHLTRRDEMSPSDWLGVAIDSYHDRRTAFYFSVNAAGVKRDVYIFDDTNEDSSWDAVWDVATSRDANGWTAEFKIPFSQLRFGADDTGLWGFNVYRRINRLNEEQYWRVPPKDQTGLVSRFGDLYGLDGIKPPRRAEVIPYVSGSAAWSRAQAGNPFATGRDGTGAIGADLKLGITSNLTLSATVNPDFGQVEADPAVVNLSAFETFFPEKRPFFNEGLDIFRFPIGLGDGDGESESLFYTRRVGRAPQGWADPRGGHAESIDRTTILGAAKLSGKTASGWTIGLLGSVTAEEEARVIDDAGLDHMDVVEPRTSYVVGRLARDLRGGRTQIGIFGTALNRSLPDNLNWLRGSAYTAGLNLTHRFFDEGWVAEGWMVGSHVRGSAEAIDLTQRSSTHYYQRPDQTHVDYDPTRTSLSGFAGQFNITKVSGNWRGGTGVDTRSPGFEANDLGFQQDADRTIAYLWLNRRWLQPGAVFRTFNINFNGWGGWSYGGETVARGGNVNLNWQFLNYWHGFMGVNRELSATSRGALRGGPSFIRPGSWNGWAGFGTDSRNAIRFGFNVSGNVEDQRAGHSYAVNPFVAWRPATNLDFMLAPGFVKRSTAWQYLFQTDALGEPHYVFGDLDQTIARMTLRGNLTFTPTLSLQVYAEPFVAVGDYTGYKEVANPRGATFADRFSPYGADQLLDDGAGGVAVDLNGDSSPDIGIGNPDFTAVSFRSNVVLRWEFNLGSTLFFVWQHGRSDFTNDSDFQLGSSISDIFRAPASNTLLVKVNYWLGL
ncbi:MAG TPA: DUF5916 domain-containing protein [Gemmatimonadales bacterium]|jgi:hypothetical protein